jgi:hypothetical protein
MLLKNKGATKMKYEINNHTFEVEIEPKRHNPGVNIDIKWTSYMDLEFHIEINETTTPIQELLGYKWVAIMTRDSFNWENMGYFEELGREDILDWVEQKLLGFTQTY